MPKKPERDTDALDIERPDAFLRRERVAQKVGVGFLIFFVAAGLAGVFGNGPLSDAMIESGAVTIRFERFARQTFRTNLEVSISGAKTPTISVTLPRDFLDRVNMLEVRPADALQQLDDESATFAVPTRDGSATLVLHYEPKRYGVLEAEVGTGQQPPVHIRQIVFF